MKIFLMTFCFSMATVFAEPLNSLPSSDRPTVMVVVGAPGEEEYAPGFTTQAGLWDKACEQAGAKRISLGLVRTADTVSDHDQLQKALEEEPKDGANEFWLVLIGHGTFDGKEAKFNLRGPDLSAAELGLWLKPFHRPVAVIDTSSASAPFLNALSGPNRVIITATRSGNEHNFARFGRFFAEAIVDPKSDLDQDGQTSLLEAFLSASARVAELYKTEGRLATEHALLDDNGDGLGTPADWFRGTRALRKALDGGSLDGARARQFHLLRSEAEQKLSAVQRTRRDELELAVEKLRESKLKMKEDDYYRQLEALMLDLAKVYAPPAEGT